MNSLKFIVFLSKKKSEKKNQKSVDQYRNAAPQQSLAKSHFLLHTHTYTPTHLHTLSLSATGHSQHLITFQSSSIQWK